MILCADILTYLLTYLLMGVKGSHDWVKGPYMVVKASYVGLKEGLQGALQLELEVQLGSNFGTADK